MQTVIVVNRALMQSQGATTLAQAVRYVPLNTPAGSGNIWTTYTFQDIYEVGGGLFHVGQRYANTQNTVQVPQYFRFDLTAAYRQPTWEIRANVLTLFNATYSDSLMASEGGRAHLDGANEAWGDGRVTAGCQGAPVKFRTDVSATLFLTDPADYDGGDLEIEDAYSRHRVRLEAGAMVVYPATSLHQVTRSVRTARFCWTQSLERDAAHREVLSQMDGAIQRLNQANADEIARRSLIGCCHDMVRAWSEP